MLNDVKKAYERLNAIDGLYVWDFQQDTFLGVCEIDQKVLKSNGRFSIIKNAYSKYQHPNQQGGLDRYIDVLNHRTGNINSLKLYKNTKGLFFKKNGPWYLEDFTQNVLYVPFQIIKKF